MFNLNKSKPVVGFDIDDVIFHLGPDLIRCYNLEYGTNKTLEDTRNLEYDRAYHVVEKYNLYKNMISTDILPVLQKKRKDIYLIFVTAREKKYADDTFEELYKNGLDFDDIFMGENKAEVCKSEKVDHFFDDALHNIINIRNKSPKTNSYLVKRDWNGPEEFKRLNTNGLICNSDIKRLTEKEVCEVLRKI